MTLLDALPLMRQGKKVKRAKWLPTIWIAIPKPDSVIPTVHRFKDGEQTSKLLGWLPSEIEIKCDDWEVIEE